MTDAENGFLFSADDVKNLATSRKFGKIKEIFAKFREFIKSKSNVLKEKGEDRGNYDQSR